MVSSTRSILDSEEAQLRLLLDNLHRDYERAAQPYLDRLAEIERLRTPSITITWNVNPYGSA